MLYSNIKRASSNELHGYCEVEYVDGKRYSGAYSNGLMHGYGVCHYANGDKYEGEFSNDMKHGYGKYTWEDGYAVECEFYNDERRKTGNYILTENDADKNIVCDTHVKMRKGKMVKWIKKRIVDAMGIITTVYNIEMNRDDDMTCRNIYIGTIQYMPDIVYRGKLVEKEKNMYEIY